MVVHQEAEGFYLQLQGLYPDEFVALRGGEVVAHAKTDGELSEIVQGLGVDRASVTFMHVRSPKIICVYRISAP